MDGKEEKAVHSNRKKRVVSIILISIFVSMMGVYRCVSHSGVSDFDSLFSYFRVVIDVLTICNSLFVLGGYIDNNFLLIIFPRVNIVFLGDIMNIIYDPVSDCFVLVSRNISYDTHNNYTHPFDRLLDNINFVII